MKAIGLCEGKTGQYFSFFLDAFPRGLEFPFSLRFQNGPSTTHNSQFTNNPAVALITIQFAFKKKTMSIKFPFPNVPKILIGNLIFIFEQIWFYIERKHLFLKHLI